MLAVQILIYPGLLWVGGLIALVLAALGRPPQPRALGRIVWRAVRGSGGLPYALSILIGVVTLALLPWPATPVARAFNHDIWRIWALTETSCLVAVLPGLTVRDRATLQAAQLGVAGRVVLWTVFLTGLSWQRAPILWIFGLLVVLCVLPIATGATRRYHGKVGEWSPAAGAYNMHDVLLIVLAAVFLEPASGLPWWQRLLLVVGLAAVLARTLPRLSKGLARWPTETMLRLCFWVALPLAVLVLLGKHIIDGI